MFETNQLIFLEPLLFHHFTLTLCQGFNLAMFYWWKLSRRHVSGAGLGDDVCHTKPSQNQTSLIDQTKHGLRVSCNGKVYNCICFYVVVRFCSSLRSLFLRSVAFLRLTTKFISSMFPGASLMDKYSMNIISKKKALQGTTPLTIPQKKFVELSVHDNNNPGPILA